MRFYKDGEQDKINKIFGEGGTLWFIEKPDTGEFFYTSLFNIATSPAVNNGSWQTTLDWHTLTEAYLTEEEALERAAAITTGGCSCCGHGSEVVKTRVTEHEFIDTNNQ